MRRRLLSSRPTDERRRRDNNGPLLARWVGRSVGRSAFSKGVGKQAKLYLYCRGSRVHCTGGRPRAAPLWTRFPGGLKPDGQDLSGPPGQLPSCLRCLASFPARGLNVVTTDFGFRPIETRMAQFRGSGWPPARTRTRRYLRATPAIIYGRDGRHPQGPVTNAGLRRRRRGSL